MLAVVFGALANPQRLRIFLHLATCCNSTSCCEASLAGIRHCVGDLGQGLNLAASTVSHHIKELRRAGLLQVERKGQKIECWVDEGTVRRLGEFLTGALEGRGTWTAGGDRCHPKVTAGITPTRAAKRKRGGKTDRPAVAGALRHASPASGR